MIKKWHLKAVVQKTISFLPKGHKVNYWFQKHITKGVQLGDEYFYDRLEHAKHHLEAVNKYQTTIVGKKTLELGTGWYPVVPFSLFLAGAADITTVDISNLTNKEKLEDTFKRFLEIIDDKSIEKYLKPLPERVAQFKKTAAKLQELTMQQVLEQLNITYLVHDARNLTMVADGSIDLVHSNNTFEHVYPNILADILKEFARVAKSGGLQSHFVDMSDHFAHFDKSINIYNFLQYSNFAWDKIMDNSIQPQNRWRFQQYLDLYRSLDIPITDTKIRPGNVEQVKSLQIHSDFDAFTPEQLAVSHCYLYSKMD